MELLEQAMATVCALQYVCQEMQDEVQFLHHTSTTTIFLR